MQARIILIILCCSWVLFVSGLPPILSCWRNSADPKETSAVCSRTPLNVQTVQGFAYFLNGGFSGEVSGVVVRCDGPTATLCIVVCVKNGASHVEHQFIVSDLQCKQRKRNGDLLFVRMPKRMNVQ